MDLLNKFPNTDFWIRTFRVRKNYVQWSWTIRNFSQFLTCDYLDSNQLRFREEDSREWWLKLYPRGMDSTSAEYISVKLFCSNSEEIYSVYQVYLVNSNGDLMNKSCGSYGNGIERFIERKVLLSDVNLLQNDSITIHCSITEYGDTISKMWERNSFDDYNLFDESVALLTQDISSLFRDNHFSDVTLKGNTTEVFHVHKDILAFRSSFFKTLLSDKITSETTLPLELPKLCLYEVCDPNHESETVNQILKYIYGGSLEDISRGILSNIYCFANCVDFKPLRNMCLNLILKDLDKPNDLEELLHFAHKHYDQHLQQHIKHLVSSSRVAKKIVNADLSELLFMKLYKKLGDSNSLKNEVFQLPNDICMESTFFKKSIIWSISQCNTFMKPNETRTVISPDFEVYNPFFYFTCKILCEFLMDGNLYLKLHSLGTCNGSGNIQFQFSIIDIKGIRKYSSEIHQEEIEEEKWHTKHKMCRFYKLKQPDIIPNDVLTVNIDITAFFSNRKFVKRKHIGTFVQDMRSLYEEEDRGDITLRCNNQDILVHKYVLCARSKVFSAMFQHDMKEKRSNIVDIVDADVPTLKAMLLYIYAGVVDDLNEEMAASLLKLGNKYDVHGLKDICSKYLRSRVSIWNAYDFLVLADACTDERLKTVAIEFIVFHAHEIVGGTSWKSFVEKHNSIALEILNIMYSVLDDIWRLNELVKGL